LAAEDRYFDDLASKIKNERRVGRADELTYLIQHGPLPEAPTVLYPEAMAKITLRDAAGRLGVQPNTLRMAIHRGRMVGHKLGRDWLVEESEVRYYEMMSRGRVGWPKGRSRKTA
jgi:excisionase family DNA binding protein